MHYLKYLWLFVFGITLSLAAQWQAAGEPLKVAGGEGQAFMRPVWSPADANLIAMTEPGYSSIWLLNLADGSLRQLTTETGAGFGFSWSNDGAAIVTRVANYSGRIPFNEVKIYAVNDGSERVISNVQTRLRDLPRWSADNRYVYAFAKRELLRFETGLATAQSADTTTPVVYLKNGQLAMQTAGEPDEKRARNITPFEGKRIINLAMSPDGEQVAFEVMGGNMFAMNADGSNLRDLGEGYRPAWSPDGQYIAYMITKDDGHRFTESDIYIVAAAGNGKPVNISNTPARIELNPTWSPEGDQIAFDDYESGEILILPIRQMNDQQDN